MIVSSVKIEKKISIKLVDVIFVQDDWLALGIYVTGDRSKCDPKTGSFQAYPVI